MLAKQVYRYYIGIDISKLTLDFTISTEQKTLFHRTISNQSEEILNFIKELKTIKGLRISNSIFGMEQTGIYCNYLKRILLKVKANFVIDNGLRIRNSFGIIRGKTDKLDSKRIADYLIKNRSSLNLYKGRREIIDQLASLLTLRTRLINTWKALKVPLKEDQGFVSKKITTNNIVLCESTVKALKSDLDSIDSTIKNIWSQDDDIKHKMILIQSIPGIGEITALQIIISSNEFTDIDNPKSFASYCGVAPFPYKSGTTVSKKTKNSSIANKKVKALMHTCSMVAICHCEELRTYYLRKLGEGKSKLSVINAIRFKLISRVYACVRGNRIYEKAYTPKVPYKLIKNINPTQMAKIMRVVTFLK